MVKRIREAIIRLAHKHPKLYTFCYLGSFVLMLAGGAFMPFLAKSCYYSVAYEKEQVTGIIEEISYDTVSFHVRYKAVDFRDYYFVIDGVQVRVPNSDGYGHRVGDTYEFWLYTDGSKKVGSAWKYQFFHGLLGLLPEIMIIVTAFAFIFTETSDRELEKRRRAQTAPKKPDYSSYSTAELYELCLTKKANVIPGKRQNRQYLICCLMEVYEFEKYLHESARKDLKAERKIGIFVWLCIGIVIVNYIVGIYFGIRLFL